MIDRNFFPSLALAPGETIKENIDYLGMTQKELAQRMGITEKHLSNIIRGKVPVSYEVALKLEEVIGPSAQFWLNLETNYQLNKARLEEDDRFQKDLDRLRDIPYKKMSELGWVETTGNRKERVRNLRKFFGITTLSLERIKESYRVAYRKHLAIDRVSSYGQVAWLRQVENLARELEAEKFSKRKLEKLIPTFRALSLEAPEVFIPKLKELCAQCGVAFIILPYLEKTYICGASFWKKDKAILALSLRGRRADIFWFSFFHELVHILDHRNSEFTINYEDSLDKEANEKASDYLISSEDFEGFVSGFNYRSYEEIVDYSKGLGVAPFILLGKLQHEKYLEYSELGDLVEYYDYSNLKC